MKIVRFEEFGLSKEIEKAVFDLGFEEATPIQYEAIPVMLKGKDLIGQAQTGTGKTAAFAIPVIEMIDTSNKNLQAVILCPTRELAIQVAEEVNKLSKHKKHVTFLPVYGGQPIDRQLKVLKKGVQIVIGTPGRVIDHLERGTIKMDEVKTVVLDEADEMLDMGFVEDIELILQNTPKSRQTAMFSATMSPQILELTKKYQKKPVHIKVVHKEMTVPSIEQIYFEVKQKNKLEALCRLLDIYNIKLGLIFCNTKRGVDELVEHLQARGYLADALHGDLRQATRDKVMNNFRKSNIEILVATDVAARGLDVDSVEAVFNYDMPQDEEYYVHRIGRTGRAGKTGKAFTFVTGREVRKLRDIQKFTKSKISLGQVPTLLDVEERRTTQFVEKLKTVIEEGELKKYIKIIERIADEDTTSVEIAAALLKMSLATTAPAAQDEIKPGNLAGNGEIVRLFFNVGRKDKVGPGDLVGAIAGETGLPGKIVGEISIFDKFSFVNVPQKYAEEVIDVMQGNQIKGKKINVEVANQKD